MRKPWDNPTRLSYRIGVSLMLGWIGFGINLKGIAFDFPPFQARLLPGLVFPMLAALAWGWRYGLLSAALGMGCQSEWFSRFPYDNGSVFISIPLLTLWIVWHGWCAGRRRDKQLFGLSTYLTELPYRIGATLLYYTLFYSTLLRMAPTGMSQEQGLHYIHFLAVEQAINAYIVLLIADVGLNLGPIRKLFGLHRRPGQIATGYVISAAVLFGVLFWLIDGLMDYYKFREQLRFLLFKAPETVFDSILFNVSSPDLFARTAFVVMCLTGGLLVAKLLRKQLYSEAALRKSESRYRRLHETMRDAFVEMDMSGRIVDCNAAYQEMLQLQKGELIGIKENDLSPAKWHAVETRIVREQVIPKGRSEVYEKEYIRADGTVFPAEFRTFLINDEDCAPVGTWAIVRDITARKRIEKEREKAMVALARSNEDLRQFAYVASHDLQEPLRMVSSYTQLIAERYTDQLDEKAHKFIHYAVDGAIRMQTLIQDLLAFSRVETHKQPLKTVDARQMFDMAVSNLKATIDETAAQVTADALPRIRADKSQLTQVFQNLIHNGMKFQNMEHAPRIHISAQQENSGWCFSVQDNGIGIESKYRDKIFLVFQRLHTRLEYPGTGIGLALCKRIIDRHGGRIWFESTPGQGTTFFFSIPD